MIQQTIDGLSIILFQSPKVIIFTNRFELVTDREKLKVCMELENPVEMFSVSLIKQDKIVGYLNKGATARFAKDHLL